MSGAIGLRGVSYTYPGQSTPVLQDINLEVASGELIALVGPSGAGKTTLCNLIARFFDPTSGVITLDGTPLTDLEIDSYRRLLGVVEQDVFLFDGTIAKTSATAPRIRIRRRLRTPRDRPTRWNSSIRLRRGWRPGSASGESASAEGNDSASPSRGRFWPIRKS